MGGEEGRALAVVGDLVGGWMRVPRPVRALLPLLGMAVLWWSSSRELNSTPVTWQGSLYHNSLHLIAYALLAIAVWLALPRRHAERLRVRLWLCAWAFALLYGIVDEIHQGYVPGRASTISDVGSDAVGAAFGLLALRRVLVGDVTWWWLVVSLLAGLVTVCLATWTDW